MKIFGIYSGLKGVNRIIKEYGRGKLIAEKTIRKEKIVKFFEEYGLEATIKAFGRKKSSIYNYRKRLRESNWNLEVLNDRSKAPINKKKLEVSPKVIEFIKKIRQSRGDIVKKKIKILLDKYCEENNIRPISESTIGRIIKKNDFFFYKERDHKGKLKRKKYKYKLREG